MGICTGDCGACPFLTCNFNPKFAALVASREPAAPTPRGSRFDLAALSHPGPGSFKARLFHPFSPNPRPNGRLNPFNPEAIL